MRSGRPRITPGLLCAAWVLLPAAVAARAGFATGVQDPPPASTEATTAVASSASTTVRDPTEADDPPNNEQPPRRSAEAEDPFGNMSERARVRSSLPAGDASLALPVPEGDEPDQPGPDFGPAHRAENGARGSQSWAPRDAQVERVQVPGQAPALPNQDTQDALPPARMREGAAAEPMMPPGDPFVLPAERLTTGPNTVELRVEVGAPEFANINLPSSFWIRVKNTGQGDAAGVVVRYPLPRGVEFIESEPAHAAVAGDIVVWQLNTLPGGAERIIKVRVRPLEKATIDHAVTVTASTGGRARTVVRRPELRVEVRPRKTKLLQGEPAVFDMTISNTGDHPARDVTVQAILSTGLKHPEGHELKLPLKEVLGVAALQPNDSIRLELEADTIAVGEQGCTILATSPDLSGEVEARAGIEVVNPDLHITAEGPPVRYPNSVVTYRITVENRGSAPARNVKVAAILPETGTFEGATPRAEWRKELRRLDWLIPELHPDSREAFTIQVRMGSVGKFVLSTGTIHDGLRQWVKSSVQTDIEGIPDLRMTVSEPRRVLDAGDETTYEIHIRNVGSKEATGLRVQGVVSPQLQVIKLEGPDPRGDQPPPQPDGLTAAFAQIDRLPPRSEVTLAIRVRARQAGDATCTVNVGHADYQGPVALSQTVVTRVMPSHADTARSEPVTQPR